MNTFYIKETNNGWLLPLKGRRVSQFLIDYVFGFRFYDEKYLIGLGVECDFVIEDSMSRHLFSPERPEELGPALTLFNQVVKSAEVFSDGELRIEFECGKVLIVEPDPNYEAWGFGAPAGSRAICMPGGEVAIWDPRGNEL